MDEHTALSRRQLETLLPREGFRPDCYRLYGGLGVGECHVLDHTPAGWEVYYSERGTKNDVRVFRTEAEACAYFLDLLRSDPTARQD